MKYISTVTPLALFLIGGVVLGQDQDQASSDPNPLSCYEQLIGEWTYEGPAGEPGSSDTADAGKVVFRGSTQWILDKKALETVWEFEVPGVPKMAGKTLITWDPAEKRIVSAGVSSRGGFGLGTVKYDAATKTFTSESKGVDGEGRKGSTSVVMRMVDADTYVWQFKGQVDGEEMPESPEWTFKRVKKPAQ